MARIRSTKPEYWDDDIVGSLSRDARLLFIATWNFADDEGLIRWAPDYLKGAAFRYDDDITNDDVAAWMQEIETAGFAYVYSTSRARHRIGFVVNFRRHQRIDKPQPAKLPVPNWRDPAVVMVYARRDGFLCAHCSEPVNERFSTDPAHRRFDPVCERIKPVSDRPAGVDDPSNIAVVHVMCAKGYDPGFAPVTAPQAPPGAFPEHSANVPGTITERSGETICTDLAPTGGGGTAEGASEYRPEETAGQSIPGTFQEHSAEEGKGSGKGRERKGSTTGAPAALFDPPAVVASAPTARAEPPLNAHTLLAEWLESRPNDRPPERIIGRVGKELRILLDEDSIPYEVVREGFMAWDRKGADPSVISSFVNQAQSARVHAQSQRPAADPRVSATTRATEHGLDLIRQVAERDGVDLATILPFAPRGELTA